MQIKNKNPVLKNLIETLYKGSFKHNSPLWRAVAEKLNKPRRKAYEVNLLTLEKHANKNETIIVPGCVLGFGEITKKLNVAAVRFSRTAKEKIEKAGGSCLSIEELYEKNPKGHRIKIMG
ncbi:MAG: 50S ribosomal protein L18e [Candidatus Aenigmarchaeota archaeon]|nr:50S ribosomal protein L18e [Candidatus Aenigmarchaeota archaeon]